MSSEGGHDLRKDRLCGIGVEDSHWRFGLGAIRICSLQKMESEGLLS